MELIRPAGRKRRHVVVTHQASSVRYVVDSSSSPWPLCTRPVPLQAAASEQQAAVSSSGEPGTGEGGRPADGARAVVLVLVPPPRPPRASINHVRMWTRSPRGALYGDPRFKITLLHGAGHDRPLALRSRIDLSYSQLTDRACHMPGAVHCRCRSEDSDSDAAVQIRRRPSRPGRYGATTNKATTTNPAGTGRSR